MKIELFDNLLELCNRRIELRLERPKHTDLKTLRRLFREEDDLDKEISDLVCVLVEAKQLEEQYT